MMERLEEDKKKMALFTPEEGQVFTDSTAPFRDRGCGLFCVLRVGSLTRRMFVQRGVGVFVFVAVA